MKKKLILSSIIVFFILFGITVSAYFIKKIEGSNHGLSSTLEDFEFVEVGDFASFVKETYLYDGTNTEYNSNDLVSKNRKTLKLTNDIKMTSDVLINADCHIDLNSYELTDEELKLLFILIVIPDEVNLNNQEITNVQNIRHLLDYIYKTEELIRP